MWFVFLCVCVCGPHWLSSGLDSVYICHPTTLWRHDTKTPIGCNEARNQKPINPNQKQAPNTAHRLHPLFIFLKVAEIPKCDSGELTSTQTEEVSLLIFFSQMSHLLVCQVNNWFLLCTLQPPHETALCVEQAADSELIIIITGVSEETEVKLAGLYCTCELTLQWPWFSYHCWCERPERHCVTWY